MGFLTSKPDPLLGLVDRLMDQMNQQQKDQREFTEKVLDIMSENQQLMKDIMGQYVGSGPNMRSSLDDRLYEREQKIAPQEWEPIMGNVFEGM